MNAKLENRRPRRSPAEIVLEELGIEDSAAALDQHLAGCLGMYQVAGSGRYQELPRYGTAVYFALEAIWGISRYNRNLAESGKIPEADFDPDWGIKPTQLINVPWIWVCVLAEAWDRYDRQGLPLGRAFGLVGSSGKRPIRKVLDRVREERAIAVWIANKLGNAKAAGRKMKLEDAIGLAANEFPKSDDSIHRIWKRYGREARLIVQNRDKTSASL